jgi:hypothetical protein
MVAKGWQRLEKQVDPQDMRHKVWCLLSVALHYRDLACCDPESLKANTTSLCMVAKMLTTTWKRKLIHRMCVAKCDVRFQRRHIIVT